jgi:hypothetical protein
MQYTTYSKERSRKDPRPGRHILLQYAFKSQSRACRRLSAQKQRGRILYALNDRKGSKDDHGKSCSAIGTRVFLHVVAMRPCLSLVCQEIRSRAVSGAWEKGPAVKSYIWVRVSHIGRQLSVSSSECCPFCGQPRVSALLDLSLPFGTMRLR